MNSYTPHFYDSTTTKWESVDEDLDLVFGTGSIWCLHNTTDIHDVREKEFLFPTDSELLSNLAKSNYVQIEDHFFVLHEENHNKELINNRINEYVVHVRLDKSTKVHTYKCPPFQRPSKNVNFLITMHSCRGLLNCMK